MTNALGPCPCQGCGKPVYWFRKSWRTQKRYPHDPARVIGARHRCRSRTCGAFMPQVRERCARSVGHGYEHRSAYAMENARRKGLAA